MFEKISDFHNTKFDNLWGGFSCVCFVTDTNTRIVFYKDGKEHILLSGNQANDLIDFVLSEYYENEHTIIEDGFSTWLMGYYDKPKSEPDENNDKNVIDTLLKDLRKQNEVIQQQNAQIEVLKLRIEELEKQNINKIF